MSLLHPVRSRRETAAQERVKEVSSMVATQLRDDLLDNPAQFQFTYPVGHKPRGIRHPGEFMGQIQERVLATLGRVSLADAAEYDPDATEQASTEIASLSGDHWINAPKEELVIVFRRPLALD